MSKAYQVIARRWRPRQFSEMVGQEHIVRTLSNAISLGRIAHAYLFVGPRGTGKTTTARLFAKALNCEDGPKVSPDNDSPVCQSIMQGNCLDVIEIDAASNNGVDDIRELCEACAYPPTTCPFKIYIVDEVHMLSTAAFNALLKTLEEPPPHVKFIFATTDSHKVLPTIVSRCQRLEFRPIPEDQIAAKLAQICEAENIAAEPAALAAVARLANGGMRDAQSILDQLISFCGDKVAASDVLEVYGLVAPEQIRAMASAIAQADYAALLAIVETLAREGRDLVRCLADLKDLFYSLVLRSIQGGGGNSDLGHALSTESLIRAADVLGAAEDSVSRGLSERVNFEVALFRCIEATLARPIDNLIRQLESVAKVLPGETEQKKNS